MEKKEYDFYDEIGNWDFNHLNVKVEKLTDWNFYKKIKENTNENSICLDLGTGGGEKFLENYPKVKLAIGSDFSNSMIKTAMKNATNYSRNDIKFVAMDNLNIEFPNNFFDLISARHTIINAKEIYRCLKENGTLVIQGINKFDCWELKELFGRGQSFYDEIPLSEKEYSDLKNAGFKNIEKYEVYENEYYQTKNDLLALLLKTPILDDLSKIHPNKNLKHSTKIEKDLLDKYIQKNTTEKGILLKRVMYGIVAKK